jgi:hypothetical protein
VHALDRGGEILGRGRGRDVPVLALAHEVGRGVVRASHHDARRAQRGGLDHDHPVALAPRRQHHAQRPRKRALDALCAHEPGHVEHVPEPVLCAEPQNLVALRSVAQHFAAQPGDALAREGEGGHECRNALLGNVAAGEHHQRLGGLRLARLQRSRVFPLEYGELAVHGRGTQAPGVQLREAEGTLGNA